MTINTLKSKITLMIFFGIVTSISAFANIETLQLEKNKKIVVDFYNTTFNQHKPKEAIKLFVGGKYTQHNPHVADGIKPFLDYFVPYFEKNKEAFVEIKRVVAENDLVILHVLSKKNKEDRGRAVVDIFRVENRKIVEHWDVAQEIPEKSANVNTMF